ncbi:MAG: phage protease [Nitrospinota bacterium]|nr:phage protease [Nitrospinota bacterium]
MNLINKKVQLVPAGSFAHEAGLQVIDAEALERILKGAKREGRDIPVDFGHESFTASEAEAAGWVALNSLETTPDGLYGKIEWTQRGEESLRQKGFRYLSPVFVFNPAHSVGGRLHIERVVSFGLTNHPNIGSMKPLLNQNLMEEKMHELLIGLKEALGLAEETETPDVLSKAVESIKMLHSAREGIANLKATLDMPEEAGEEEVLEAAKTAIESTGGTIEETASTIEELARLREELTSMKEKELKEKIGSAIESGKILPAQKEWAYSYASSDPEGFSRFLANSRSIVRMGEIVSAKNSGSAVEAIGEVQEKINSLLGISREVFDTYNS